jgi:hypothetical protein
MRCCAFLSHSLGSKTKIIADLRLSGNRQDGYQCHTLLFGNENTPVSLGMAD